MAKPTVRADPLRLRAELLYCSTLARSKRRGAIPHQHPQWQVELVLNGVARLHTAGETSDLGVGDVAILPPGEVHGFSYRDGAVRWITLRFALHGMIGNSVVTRIVRSDASITSFGALLRELLENQKWPYAAHRAAAAGHCLAGLVAFAYTPREMTPRHNTPWHAAAQLADDFMLTNTQRRITVEDVARAMGYSLSHAGAVYRQVTGRTLKAALDSATVEAARHLLTYSEQRISDIAETMEFSDVYAFSRFFKRLTGRSPRSFRNAYLEGERLVLQG